MRQITDDGLSILAHTLFDAMLGADWQVALWTAAGLVPSRTTTLADLTEASYPGYARQVIPSWSYSALTTSQRVTAESPVMTFARGAGAGAAQDIWGHALVRVVGGTDHLVWLWQRNGSPVTLTAAGDKYLAQIRVADRPDAVPA